MITHSQVEPALSCENRPIRRDHSSMTRDWSNPGTAEAAFEFGRFRVLLRQRQLVADGVPIELGTRALDLLLVLLEDNGSLVTRDELFRRVWPGIVVSEANLKVQISALRRALGEDRDFIRTEIGRGYRFTAAVRSTVARTACQRTTRRGHRSNQRSLPRRTSRRPLDARRVSRSLRQTF
jgi:DNA-binding winged helix-turn-helix (wHTH) protein